MDAVEGERGGEGGEGIVAPPETMGGDSEIRRSRGYIY